MTDRLRTGLVGCGKVGLTHALALSSLGASRFSAVCDADLSRARAFGERFGVAAYQDTGEMVRSERLDMVSVCTPHPQHEAAIVAAARAGAHSLVEKPFAADLGACDRSMAAARDAGVTIGVMSQRRWYRPVVRMRRAIDEGRIGAPVMANVVVLGWRDEAYYQSDPWRGKWASEGGGVLVNQTPHQLDLLLWLMGPAAEVYGQWDNFNHPYIEVEDTAVAVVRFRSGAVATLALSNSQNPGLYGRVHVYGSNGASIGAQTEGGSMFVSGMSTKVDPPINDLWTIPGEEPLLAEWQAQDRAAADAENPLTFYHERQIEDFLEGIVKARPPTVDAEAGRRVVELFTAIYRSQRDHRPCALPLRPEDGEDYDGRLVPPPHMQGVARP